MTSPAHRQYLKIKERYPDAILLFRMGDFYEMFGEDAKQGSQALQITLTSREFAKGDRVPMAGIPHHAVQGYLKRFVDQGFKVAICEQLSEPGQGLVDRDVVRVVTAGTLTEPALLDESRNNFLAAVNCSNDTYGLAYAEVTTGEFALTEFRGENSASALEAEVMRLAPAEILLPEDVDIHLDGNISTYDDYRFDAAAAGEALCRHFGVQTLEGFGCDQMPVAVGAAGAILSYVQATNQSLLPLLRGLRTYQVSAFMSLDRYTRRNLELTESARSGTLKSTLLWVLDRTQTGMGGRMLRRLIGQPLLDIQSLNKRLEAVEELARLPILLSQVKSVLKTVADIERLTGRVCQGAATVHELVALKESLSLMSELKSTLGTVESEELRQVRDRIDLCPDITGLIERAVSTPSTARKERKDEGPIKEELIKTGYHPELDEIRASIRDSREWIAQLEGQEQSRTGIKSLKVGYNKVFGYYIEISKANASLAPDDYIRKQTLVNGERFVTSELKEHESRLLQAEERIGALEATIFSELLETVGRESPRLFASAQAVAHLDVYRSLAEVAVQNGYGRPELSTGDDLAIVDGRHPVVEASLQSEGFIPNDCHLSCRDHQILVISGPNMGGKSTYLRQVALIVLMAQIGSFVPAQRARIGLVDRIFTRVGAQDDIAAGQSTFMVEMVETANIVNHATERSLLILDEVGRGTSTYDGLAIARAVLEYIHDRIGARTLFATHYHELTVLADRLKRVHNANLSVSEENGEVVFLHKVVPGGADRSYGIHVARLAGLPSVLTDRADEALIELETQSKNGHRGRKRPSGQLPLFNERDAASEVLQELLSLDISQLTPIQALTRLHELQQKGQKSS